MTKVLIKNVTNSQLMVLRIGLVSLLLLGSTCVSLWAQTPFGDDSKVTPPTARVGAVGGSLSASTSTMYATFSIDRAWVNVRSGPGTKYSVVKTLPQGTSGSRLSEINGWTYMVFSEGTRGWVRSDLLASGDTSGSTSGNVSTTTSTQTGSAAKAYLEKSFTRWDKHLASTVLDFSKLSRWWKLGKAWSAYQSGDYKTAYELAQNDSSDPAKAQYLMAKCLFQLGQFTEAQVIMKKLEKPFEDAAFRQVLDAMAQPYIDEPIVFKFGGFDTIASYRAKKAKDARLGLESDEYYKDFVDINTWKWKSQSAYNEFSSIGGIDCSGLVQQVEKEAFAKAGVTWPIPGRTSVAGLPSPQFTKEVNPGVKPPPPPDIRPGDLILLDYGHNRYGHSMIYRGIDANGNIQVTMMGDTACQSTLAPDHFQYYKGTYRMNGMDKVREKLTA
ncbi:MAG: SH3 domain-containing protein [Candidatus Ozemobacteraceae bacterium]